MSIRFEQFIALVFAGRKQGDQWVGIIVLNCPWEE